MRSLGIPSGLSLSAMSRKRYVSLLDFAIYWPLRALSDAHEWKVIRRLLVDNENALVLFPTGGAWTLTSETEEWEHMQSYWCRREEFDLPDSGTVSRGA